MELEAELERKKIIGSIKTVLEMVPKTELRSVTRMIDEGMEVTASNVGKYTGLSGNALDSVVFLFDSAKTKKDAIILALNAAIEMDEYVRKDIEMIDMSWTGPIQFSVAGRSNASIMEEIITNATNTITIVGYSLTDEAGRIIRLLEAAMRNGVCITFVIHTDDKSCNVETLKKNWRYHKRPKIYTRRPSEADVYFKIHAKMLVSDSKDMLVTSANLTWHGMSNNFEIGLRVRGKTAEKGHALISDLIMSGYLKEVQW